MGNTNEKEELDNEFTLIATYYGGCGSSQMAKRELLKKIINYLNENAALGKEKFTFTSEIYNLQILEKKGVDYSKDITDGVQFQHFEFNIFLVKNKKKILVYTSDRFNKEKYIDTKPFESFIVEFTNRLYTTIANN